MPRITSNGAGILNGSRINRAEAENAISEKNKSYYDAFMKATSAPSVLCTYWSIDDSSSYSESTKNVKFNHNAKKFVRISKMVIYNYDSEDLEDKTTDDRRLSINLAQKSSFMQPGSILPKEGDHLLLASQSNIAKPYMVSKVTPLKFLDKEIWNITYVESTIFTLNELEALTVSRKTYVPENSASGGSALIDEDLKEIVDVASTVVDKLQSKFVELFYDVTMDALVFKPHGVDNRIHYNYYANSRMQELLGVLRYGYDKNKLFIQNTYGFDAIEENYDKSLYGSLVDKYFLPIEDDECPATPPENIRSEAAMILSNMFDLRERIFSEYRGFPEYSPRYSYYTRLYLRPKTEHMILTRYYNSHVMLVDMFDTAGFFDPRLKRSYVNYQIKSPVILPLLDMYMEDKWDEILNYCKKLKRFNPSKFCIDDYFGVPLMIIAISKAIKQKTKSDYYGTYK